jgi:hypothetical protein
MITIKEHQFLNRDNRILITAEKNRGIFQYIWYQLNIYAYILINVIYPFILNVLEL